MNEKDVSAPGDDVAEAAAQLRKQAAQAREWAKAAEGHPTAAVYLAIAERYEAQADSAGLAQDVARWNAPPPAPAKAAPTPAVWHSNSVPGMVVVRSLNSDVADRRGKRLVLSHGRVGRERRPAGRRVAGIRRGHATTSAKSGDDPPSDADDPPGGDQPQPVGREEGSGDTPLQRSLQAAFELDNAELAEHVAIVQARLVWQTRWDRRAA